jgi:PAS domain S-box-containing protein
MKNSIESDQKMTPSGDIRYRNLFDSMLEGVCWHEIVCDESGKAINYRILAVNKSFENILSLSRDEITGRLATDVYRVELPPYLDIYSRVAESGEPAVFESYFAPLKRFFSISAFSSEKGKFTIIFKDITEQKTAEGKYYQLVNAVEKSSEGFIITDTRGIITYANATAQQLYDYSLNEVIGKLVFRLTAFSKDNDIILRDLFKKGRWSGESQQIRRDGSTFSALLSLSTIKDIEDRKLGFVGLIRDNSRFKAMESALRQSEERLRLIIENSTNLFYIHSAEHELTYLSPQCSDFLQCEPEEAMHRWTEFATDNPVNQKGLQQTEKAILSGRRQPPYPLELRGKMGRIIWVEVNEAPVIMDGKTTALVGSLTNITQRRDAETRISHLNTVLRAIRKVDQLITRETDRDKLINRSCELLVQSRGYSCAWLVLLDENRKPVASAQAGLEEEFSAILKLIEDGNFNYCSSMALAHDELIVVDDPTDKCGNCPLINQQPGHRAYTIRLEYQGNFFGLLSVEVPAEVHQDSEEQKLFNEVAIDISFALHNIEVMEGRRRVEEALRGSESLLRTIADNYPNSYLSIIENDFTIGFTSGQEFRKQGLDPAEFIGMKLEDLYGEKFGLIRDYYEKTFNGEECSFELEMNDQFQSYRTVPFYEADGSINRILSVVENITETKQTELVLQKIQKLESIGTLAGGIAHDFNNVLMGLYGNISLIREHISGEHPAQKYLQEIDNSMTRATSLTNQLLTFAIGGEPIRELTSVSELIRDIVQFDLAGSSIKPIFDFEDGLRAAELDRGQIQQVFSNLIINSIQAMPQGGHIFVTAANADVQPDEFPGLKAGKYIRISVRDEGTGIKPSDLNRIFDPYFSSKDEGSGLGLATSYSIINRHDGLITADSAKGEGATFILYLPASESAFQHVDDSSGVADSDSHRKARVLLMDDEEMVRNVASAMLEIIGYDVVTAKDGLEAVKLYSEFMNTAERFDVVIVDLTVPGGMGGQEAVKEILKINPDAKCIVSSGYVDGPVMSSPGNFGFSAVAPKPYSIRTMKGILRKVLEDI